MTYHFDPVFLRKKASYFPTEQMSKSDLELHCYSHLVGKATFNSTSSFLKEESQSGLRNIVEFIDILVRRGINSDQGVNINPLETRETPFLDNKIQIRLLFITDRILSLSLQKEKKDFSMSSLTQEEKERVKGSTSSIPSLPISPAPSFL